MSVTVDQVQSQAETDQDQWLANYNTYIAALASQINARNPTLALQQSTTQVSNLSAASVPPINANILLPGTTLPDGSTPITVPTIVGGTSTTNALLNPAPLGTAIATPVLGALNTFPAVVIPTIPALSLNPPTLNTFTAPTIINPADPGNAPNVLGIALPIAPVINTSAITLPSFPNLPPVAVPVFTPPTMPTLVANQPAYNELTTPTNTFVFNEVAYTDALLNATTNKILNDLLNGGYGIDVTDENAMWYRAAERELVNTDIAIMEASRAAAARGFVLPPGSLFDQISVAELAAQQKNSSLNREIAIKRADMFVENRRFMVTQGISLEGILINYYASMQERAINVQKLGVELGIQVFTMQLDKYKVQWDVYKTQVDVYNSLLHAVEIQNSIFRTQIEAAQLSAEVQKIVAEIYQTEVNAVNAVVELYKAQMEAARVQAEIERLQLEGYKITVDAYSSKVQANYTQFQMFKAQIESNELLVETYKAQAEAYLAVVRGLEAPIELQKVAVELEIAENAQILDKYRVDMQRYGIDVQRTVSQIQALMQKYDADIQNYGVQLKSVEFYNESQVSVARANASISLDNVKETLEILRFNVTSLLKQVDQQIGVTEGTARLSAQMLLGSLQSITSVTAALASS